MKDIIANRLRIKPSTKTRLLWISVKENGPLWTGLMGVYYATSAIADRAFAIGGRAAQKTLPAGAEQPGHE